MSAPRTQYARSGEVHLAYQVIGEGPRDIVLVLDWASHLEALWEQSLVAEFISSLNRFARVIWFDMRGVGLSDRVVDAAVSAEDWLEDVSAVMDAAGSERATIVGHGHAVQLALLFAATHPERVDSLVLINGFARLLRADDYPAGMPLEARDSVLKGIETNWGTGRLATVLAPSVASQPGVKDWYGRVERYAASPGTALAKMRAISELDVRNVLPLVAAPTLVVHNRDDWFIRAGHGRYLAEHIAGARLLERDSADHWPIGDADLLGAIEEFVVGSRSEDSDVDRFLATVLFVDVADSTERVSEIGDRSWGTLLGRFETTVARVLDAHRGELVNTAGDGVLATFDGPARGIRCAWSIRDAVKQNGLEVRSGLHTGELTRRNGGVSGIAVHIGARVSALAEPGEVLVTRTVRDLVAGSGIAFEDRGEHALKGVADRWALYAASG
ncbi:MAG: adenylate/guanylate cyclase domain-containing protein [Actinomycetota bacterium]|nr:adenylate/guanylate cyclase domain-containing protein [Actinomycetota bacterium]